MDTRNTHWYFSSMGCDDPPISFTISGLILTPSELEAGKPDPLKDPALFREILLTELDEKAHKLSLLDYCRHGGSPDFQKTTEVYGLSVMKQDANQADGVFSVLFTETYYNGCKNIAIEEQHRVGFSFFLKIATEEITVEGSEVWPNRQYEKDEY